MIAPVSKEFESRSEAILAALPDLLRDWLPGGEFRGDLYVAINPMRNDRNLGSFQINTRTGRWKDFAIGRGGQDAASLYAYLFTQGDYRRALKRLHAHPLVRAIKATGIKAAPAKPANTAKSSAVTLARVQRIYSSSVGLQGQPASSYLLSRDLHPTDAWGRLRATIQYYPGVGACPTLIAPFDDLEGALVGLHRTFLQASGAKLNVPNPRRMLGRVRGCSIRLGKASDSLIICEGLEDGLGLYQELGIPVWVAGGASFLPLMKLPNSISSLTIAADNDPPGELAAIQAADALQRPGRDVRIMKPLPEFKDFNDQLRGTGRAK